MLQPNYASEDAVVDADPVIELQTVPRAYRQLHHVRTSGSQVLSVPQRCTRETNGGNESNHHFLTPPDPPPTLDLHTLNQPSLGPTHIFLVRRPNHRVQVTIGLDEK